jgi:hypothetical protein
MKHILLLLLLTATAVQATEMKLWYDKPAADWMTETLPIGNGELGAMVFGKTYIERIQFNEKSLWTGNEQDVGSYQPFGDLFLKLDHDKPQDYRRKLDIERGVAAVSYTFNGVRYRRELIASHPDGVIAIRLSADKPGAYSGKIWLTDMHAADVLADGKRLTATGVLNNGMDYESQVLVLNEGGTVAPVFENGFDNQPVPRLRPEVPVLDGTQDVYLSLRNSDKPVFGFYDKKSNDDAALNGAPMVLDGEWFDRGVSFQAPNDFSFNLDGKYEWLTFHARVAQEGTLQVILDGKTAREIPAATGTQYVAIPVAGVKTLKLQGIVTDPQSKKRPEVLLGRLRLSPAKDEPAKDPGLVRRWKTIPGFYAQFPPVALALDKCDSVTILLGARTSYLADHTKGWRGPHPHEALTALMDQAAKKPFSELLATHEKDHRSLFGRVTLDLGKTPAEISSLPTDERFLRYAKGEADPGFESLFFQFGRYLLIGSSRSGGLPANLQGVWNERTAPAWRSDYHSNINIQMNYWPADLTGLGECHVPLFDFIAAQAPVYRKNMQADPEMAKRFPNHRGWTIRTESGVFGASSWELNIPANAWYCQHLWQHFEFGQDKDYLRKKAYPMMKETCEFWIDHLITMPDGRLATPDGWSAEWGPREPAVTYDQQLIWDLFNNTVAAADVLGIDKEFRDQIAGMRDKLVTSLHRQARPAQGMVRRQGRHDQQIPPRLPSLGLLSGQADHRAGHAGMGRRRQGLAQRPRRRGQRLELGVEDQLLGAVSGCRTRLQAGAHPPATCPQTGRPARPPERHLRESARHFVPARQQLRRHRRHRRDAPAKPCRGEFRSQKSEFRISNEWGGLHTSAFTLHHFSPPRPAQSLGRQAP